MSRPAVISLHDPETGATAEILPGRGCACLAARLPGRGQLHDVVWSPAGFREGDARPTAGGIPLLCPFPGRLASTTMTFQGRSFELEPGDQAGRPIHGFAHDRPWRVEQAGASSVSSSFRLSRDAPDRLACWPADFELRATWGLEGSSLVCGLRLTADGSMPAAMGLHPYLPVPLVAGGDPEACLLSVPARLWQPQKDLLPSGSLEPASTRTTFPGCVPLAGQVFDDVFAGLDSPAEGGGLRPEAARGQIVTAVIDPQAGLALEIWSDPVFSACVVFTPPHRQAVCLEPCTALPGSESFDPSRGWRILAAGESLTATLRLRLREWPSAG
jgi:aldose 1-epimerase